MGYMVEVDEGVLALLLEKALQLDSLLLEHVPEEHKTYEMCLEAVKENPMALEFVPEEYHKELAGEVGIELPKKNKTRGR